MQREIRITSDGSHTIAIPAMNVTYHSHHGAIAEGMHVFVDAGYRHLRREYNGKPFTILEIGFGTGLNALLTLREAAGDRQPVRYLTIETAPLNEAEYTKLNHGVLLGLNEVFLQLHHAPWEEDVAIDPCFTLHKKETALGSLLRTTPIDCIYFDAFAPNDQPELWTVDVFRHLFGMLNPGGILVTYCSKSVVRKAMQEAGFTVTKIPGPQGKRDMVRAFKPA